MRPDPLAHRSELLDCIRAVAIVMVLIFHVATRYPPDSLDPVAWFFWKNGFLGVDMFFPLSGFLITRFLLSKDRMSRVGPAFFLRRIFRIIPLYYAAVGLYILASIATGVDQETFANIWGPLTFTTGWYIFIYGAEAVPYQVTWSLSVEELAYVLFGAVAWVARRHFTLFIIICCLVSVVLRTWLYAQGAEEIHFFPAARLDAIAYGGLTAILMRDHGGRSLLWLLGLLAAASLFALTGEAASKAISLTQIPVVICCIIVIFETALKPFRAAWLRPIALYGFYSYFIYLFHFFNVYLLFEIAERMGMPLPSLWLMTGLVMILTYLQAVLSYRYFEGPLMQYGRRLEGRLLSKRANSPQNTMPGQ
ncbi:Acyltransferase 3 [Roseobacter sp. SK209-2-6]|uniref:acyltransferase family protein n=1 Tax=Roseobacter sp. SK209-2-6 TaxID=388739 RepID=UPI0000F3F4B4|nr:acyltransferase [Roseobacter sp. SK209-2-6]EBA14561.1 Acyltransferase 3 [Roseobacter sp. SK209-2-6]